MVRRDGGLVINPDGAINQLEGGIVQGISWALRRGAARPGRHRLARLGTYPVIKFSECRRSSSNWSTRAPITRRSASAKRRGRPTVAAIGNAVAQALGTRLRDLPLTRDRVMAVLLKE